MFKNLFASIGRTAVRAAVRPGGIALSVGLLLPVLLAGCDKREQPVAPSSSVGASPEGPNFTAATGSVSTLVGRSTFNAFSVRRQTGNWVMTAHSDPLDIAVQTIVFQPGGQSGWHSHPGPVFIQVVEGTMTFYESNDPHCQPIVKTAGQGYLDAGDHAHIARNETQHEAKNVVTYFAPVGAPLRIDVPAPGNCPF
jgi:quercetin dioxygenase-like cupin family protein